MEKNHIPLWKIPQKFRKRIMRYSLLLTFLLSFIIQAGASAQKISVRVEAGSLDEAFQQIIGKSKVQLVYNTGVASAIHCAGAEFTNKEIHEILETLLAGTGLTYKAQNGIYMINRQAIPETPQQKTVIKGKVKDNRGALLPGVSVMVKGTTIGVATDVNGEFELVLSDKSPVLVFSFVGMKTKEITAEGVKPLNVVLEEDSEILEDVVVTGYQTISKERATGAYSIINAKDLEQKPTVNISSALNGLVPGLAVSSSPVEGTARFIIRGKGTLQDSQTDSDPLIVVDGFPVSGYSDDSDPFATVNPNDVESITVLKDAAATSIYGARAANGVIVITTKKGKAGNKLDISADAFWSVSSRADLDYLFNMASAENQFRYVELMNQYSPITVSNDPYTNPRYHANYMSEPHRLIFERDIKGNITADEYEQTKQRLIEAGNRGVWKDDLNDYIFRHALRSQYNVALRGTTERMNYAFSASYDDEKGYLKGNDSRRVMLNMSTAAKLTKNLTFNIALNSTFSNKDNNGPDLYTMSRYISPWTRLVDDNGNFIHVATDMTMPWGATIYEPILNTVYEGKTPADWHFNPAEDRQYTENETKAMNYRVQGGFDYATTWGLDLSAKGQYEWRRTKKHEGYAPESYFVRNLYNTYSTLNPTTGMYDTYFPLGGIFTDNGNEYEAYNLRGQASYNYADDRHALTLLAGTEILSSTLENIPSVTRYGYNEYTNSVETTPDYNKDVTNIFGQPKKMPYKTLGTLSTWEDRFFSVYANASYTYHNKYSLTASFRTDASNFQSKSQRDKFSPFWSVGASWLLSHEKFLAAASWLDQLKLRASFGIAGVAAGKRGTSSVTTLATHPGNAVFPGSFNSISTRGNETLTWEKSRTFNVGLDMSVFGNKLSGSIEFYNKFSYDVLSDATVPTISQGTPSALFNNAEVLNRGVELSLSSNLRIAGDLKWRGTLNYAYNHNEVKKFDLMTPYYASYPGYVKNYPTDLILVMKPAGYTPEGYVVLQGKDGTQQTILDEESSHDGETIGRSKGESLADNNWFYYLGSYTPKSELSFSSQFVWKGLTLSFMITGRFGYYTYKDDEYDTRTNLASYSKHLDRSFAVYDEGYANQTGYSALPLYNDENYQTYINTIGETTMYFISSNFASSYISGDHIRLNEVYLGYDLPERLLARQNVFKRVNIYAQASNLGLIWSKNGEMDPDYPAGNLKPMPTFTFGLKLSFKNW